ncbi:hypothetical protein N2152v2_009911 [Parachlorella kessleri]
MSVSSFYSTVGPQCPTCPGSHKEASRRTGVRGAKRTSCSAGDTGQVPRPLRIGTRGSPLALAQAHLVRDRLQAHNSGPREPGALQIVHITTTGDVNVTQPLREAGGAGLFTQEIDDALVQGRIDVAVHSLKDVPASLGPGLTLACTLPREDVRDALISLKAASLAELPPGSIVGTSSMRRQAQVLARHPHLKASHSQLKVANLRGSVQSRLAKLEVGECDATLLALAGLKRLGLEGRATSVLSVAEMLPAVGQGAIGVFCREADTGTAAALGAISHEETRLGVMCERAFLSQLESYLRQAAIAGLAEANHDGMLEFRGLMARPDGSRLWEVFRVGPLTEADALALGRDAGRDLLGLFESDNR